MLKKSSSIVSFVSLFANDYGLIYLYNGCCAVNVVCFLFCGVSYLFGFVDNCFLIISLCIYLYFNF